MKNIFTRIIESFETQIASNFDNKEKPHHEYRMAFQSRISFEKRIGFKEMDVNLFEQKNFVKISNVSAVYDNEAQNRFRSFSVNGVIQFQEFFKEQ